MLWYGCIRYFSIILLYGNFDLFLRYSHKTFLATLPGSLVCCLPVAYVRRSLRWCQHITYRYANYNSRTTRSIDRGEWFALYVVRLLVVWWSVVNIICVRFRIRYMWKTVNIIGFTRFSFTVYTIIPIYML